MGASESGPFKGGRRAEWHTTHGDSGDRLCTATMGDSVASSQGEQLQGDPSLAVVPGADLQRAFHAGLDTLRMGQMASAASQFGNAFVGAEIALKMGVKRGS